MPRITLALVATLVAITLTEPAQATLNACAAAKKLCVAKKTAALLKCHSKNEKPPAGLDPAKFLACLQKAKDKFDGGANPAKGCFAKLEAKFPGCLTTNDTAALEATVDAFVDDVVCELDPGSGTCPTPTVTPTPLPTPTTTSTPAGCFPNGQNCSVGSQCCSLVCMGGQCQTPTCSDGVKNGNETGVDCGGGTCPVCPLGQGCLAASDCVVNSVCQAGTCVCGAGQVDCNANTTDGCEVNTASDPNNCGFCGLICNLPNAVEACTGGVCTVASCDSGYKNCDNMNGNGCEINSTSDNNNCGLCGLVCPGIQTCVNSVCQ